MITLCTIVLQYIDQNMKFILQKKTFKVGSNLNLHLSVTIHMTAAIHVV